MDYQLISYAYGAVALFTMAFICYKDFELIITGQYPVITGYGGALLGATIWPVTWFLYLLSWLRYKGDVEQAEEVVSRRVRHGQRLRLGDEAFRVYRIGKNIKLKLIGAKRG